MVLAAFAAMVSLNSCDNKGKKEKVKVDTTEVVTDTVKADSTQVQLKDTVKVAVEDTTKVVK